MAVQTLERDGVDYNLETGTGFVSKVEHDPAKRNAQVQITAEGLQYPLKAWVDTKGAVWADVQRAFDQQVRIDYRIEVKRARGVAASKPWAELKPKDKLRDLVGIHRAGQGAPAVTPPQAPPTSQHPQAPENPPAGRTAPDPAIVSSALDALLTARRVGIVDEVDQAIHDARKAGASQEAIDEVLAGRGPAPAQRGPIPPADDEWSTNQGDPATLPAQDPRAVLSAALMRLRAMNRGKADDALLEEQRARVVELGATLQQLRWAADLDPATGEPLRQLPAATVNGHVDPDRTGPGAPHFPTGENAPGAGPRPSPAPSSGLGTRAALPRGYEDPPPYKRTYETGPLAGQLNPSSYEVGVVLELVGLAQKLLIRRARAIADHDGTPVAAPTLDEVRDLAQKLMLATDRVQIALRGGSVDRQSGLYRRVRWAVQESIDWYPWPGAEDLESEHAWHQVVVEHATTTVRVGLDLLGGGLTAPPS